MAAVGWRNVIMLPILLVDNVDTLYKAEIHFIRTLVSNFNVQHASAFSSSPIPAHLLGCWWSGDTLAIASRILRQLNPRLSCQQWVSLIIAVRGVGDGLTATKLRRVAARCFPSLRSLLSAPQISFPCPVPKRLLRYTQLLVRQLLSGLPSSLQSYAYVGVRLPSGEPFCMSLQCFLHLKLSLTSLVRVRVQ